MRILNSASRIVLIIMSISVSALTFVGMIDPKDFMLLATMTFTYYYTRNGGNSQDTSNQ